MEKFKPPFAEQKACKERCDEISKRLSELQFNFKNVRVTANAGETLIHSNLKLRLIER